MLFSPRPASDDAPHGRAFHVPAYREVHPRLVVELRRARRYERPLSVALVGLQAPARPRGERSAGGPAPLGEMTPTVFGLLGSYLCNALRETDIIAAVPDLLAFAVFMPETDRAGAELALERYRSGFLECAGFALRGGVAAFPGDGLTVEDVLERARAAWRQESRPDDVPLAKPRQSHG